MPKLTESNAVPRGALLTTAARALARGTDLDATIGEIVAAGASAVGADRAVVLLQDPDRAELQLVAAVGMSAEALELLGRALTDPDHPIAVTTREGRPAHARDEAGSGAGSMRRTFADAALIVSRDGIETALGALSFEWSDGPPPGAEALTLVAAVADLLAVAIDRARLASLISERAEWFERLAHTDPLTGLANLRTLNRVLELELVRAGRQGSEVSIAVFDIDDFEAVNDSAGRDAGDDVLRSVAAVLNESIRLVDTVARAGGDEFVVVAPGGAGSTLARRVIDGVAGLPRVDGRSVSVSAGLSRFPSDGTTADELVESARRALEESRADGPGRLSRTGLGDAV